jgi:hypothetical protein
MGPRKHYSSGNEIEFDSFPKLGHFMSFPQGVGWRAYYRKIPHEDGDEDGVIPLEIDTPELK